MNLLACFYETLLYNSLNLFCFQTILYFLLVHCFYFPKCLICFTNLNFSILNRHIYFEIFPFLSKHLWAWATTAICSFFHHQADLWKIQLFYHLVLMECNKQDFSNFQVNLLLYPKDKLDFVVLIIQYIYDGIHAHIL